MSSLTLYGAFALIVFIFFGYGYEKYEGMKNQVAAQQIQIDQLKQSSAAATQVAKQANTQANAAVTKIDEHSKQVMNEKVSNDCQQAMKYLIDQAKQVNK